MIEKNYVLTVSHLVVLVLFISTSLGCLSEVKAEERVAFLVGIKNYKEAPLSNTIRDTEIISKALNSVGFKVTRYTDLDGTELLENFKKFLNAVSHNSTILFYYSGHGVGIQGKNYLAPLRNKVTGKTTIVSLERIVAQLEKNTRGVRLVFIDSCRNDPRNMEIDSTQISQGFSGMGGSVGTLISFATAIGRTASDGIRYSPYSKALSKTITLPNITINQVLQKTRKLVRGFTRGKQVPWERSALIEDFYFSKQNFITSNSIAAVTPDLTTQNQQNTSPNPQKIWYFLRKKMPRLAFSTAEKLMKKDAQTGTPIVAYFLLRGLGTGKNPQRAIELLTSSAKAGSSSAAFFLAKLYYKGRYLKSDFQAAEQWLIKAADLGHPRAQKLVKTLAR
jgi:hypothetical protein